MRRQYYKGKDKELFDAVWQYCLDHSDMEKSGTLFVKFHTNSKESFAKSIKFRQEGFSSDPWKEEVQKQRREKNVKLDSVTLPVTQLKEAYKKLDEENRLELKLVKESFFQKFIRVIHRSVKKVMI